MLGPQLIEARRTAGRWDQGVSRMPERLSDSEAKAVMRRWPSRTGLWQSTITGGFWLRAQPVSPGASHPRLIAVGMSRFATQPDGMWVFLAPDEGFADVVAIEVSRGFQNLGDKRSRYMASTSSMTLLCPVRWLNTPISVQHGARWPRWRAAATFGQAPERPLRLPVRLLRALYFLPNAEYRSWVRNHSPMGHEYFSQHSSLATFNSPAMQDFLRRLSPDWHFYP